MRLVFSDLSRQRLHEIQSHIAYHNIRAAEKVVDRIIYAAEVLGDHPELGPIWSRDAGQSIPTRAFVVSGLPYRIHYRVAGDRVEVIP